MRLLVLALVLALVVPSARAQSPFAHRVVLDGRLVGADGAPIVGRLVSVTPSGDSFDFPCEAAQQNVTDENGDFAFCYHKDAVASGTSFEVRAGSVVDVRNFDGELRAMRFTLRDIIQNGTRPAGWNETFSVRGRVVDRGAATIEGVPVMGVPRVNVPVRLELSAPGTTNGSVYELMTDAAGDLAATFRLVPGQDPASLVVRVTVGGSALEGKLDTVFHESFVDFRFPLAGGEDAQQPAAGAAPPAVSLTLVLLVVAAVSAQVLRLRRRKK